MQICLENLILIGEGERKMTNAEEFYGILYSSEAMRDVCRIIQGIADDSSTVLITGETGTGKELVARAIFQTSNCLNRNFVVADCTRFRDRMTESELFGHKKGSFTGAHQDRRGLFEEANSGTIFLDEISEIPIDYQAQLLRILEEQEVRPVGENNYRKLSFRVLAASNEPLEELVRQKKFRADLYYRLNVIRIHLPPLRERLEELPILAYHFWKSFSSRLNISSSLSYPVLHEVMNSRGEWPGNVRELKNFVENKLRLARININGGGQKNGSGNFPKLADTIEETRRKLIKLALEKNGGSIGKAAKDLGTSRSNVVSFCGKYGIEHS
ncbi:sigma-54-dependent Fis family transcriptional regulator [Candidatus Giovannonibacteria bacterium]|nr:sigma-54-dependent Fis family transcriptional regulator [Candidatus Giovannonibacteria bacterium]